MPPTSFLPTHPNDIYFSTFLYIFLFFLVIIDDEIFLRTWWKKSTFHQYRNIFIYHVNNNHDVYGQTVHGNYFSWICFFFKNLLFYMVSMGISELSLFRNLLIMDKSWKRSICLNNLRQLSFIDYLKESQFSLYFRLMFQKASTCRKF